MKITFLLTFIICLNTYAQAPYSSPGMQEPVRLDEAVDNPPFGFYEYLPQNFNETSGDTYPIVFFFHGIGEKGNGSNQLHRVLKNGMPRRIKNGTHYPAIVISAQAPYGSFNGANFLQLYNYFTSKYPVDLNRVYVTGLSAGGGGTWRVAEAHPDKIAAILPICGANRLGNPSAFLQTMPIWAHHNFADKPVNRIHTVDNVNRIANNNKSVEDVYPFGPNKSVANTDYTMQYNTNTQNWIANVGVLKPEQKMSFTLYKKGNHDAWTKTYNNPAVWEWLFAQSLANDDTLSSKNINNNNTLLYYNSTQQVLTLNSKTPINYIYIYNVQGNLISKDINKSINVSQLTNGVYFLKVVTNTGASTKQFIKY